MKELVSIYVPAVGLKYDILVPDDVRIKNIISLVAGAVENLSNHKYVASGEEYLYSAEKGILLRPNATLEKYGIQNGDHLVMM